MPLYGVSNLPSDPSHTVRVIMASNRGTLMELGLSPSMTSGLIVQLFTALGLTSPSEDLHEPFSNLVTLLVTLFQAVFSVYSGSYGSSLPFLKSFLIVFQLMSSGFILLLMDELLSSGWGMGSGSNLFIATNYCETVVWRALSVVTYSRGRFQVFEGALLALVHLFLKRKNKVRAVKEALFRKGAPNISSLLATGLVFCLVVYLQGLRVHLPLTHNKVRNSKTTYPVKLFYTSTMPVIIQNQVTSNCLAISSLLFRKYPNNLLSAVLGRWKDGEPVGGLAWVLRGPNNFKEEKVRFLLHAIYVVGSCGLFSRAWIEMSGSAPKDVARKLKEKDMTIIGYRQESTVKVLYKYIPLAAWTGGFAIGIITVISEILGAIGSGTGILLAVGTIFGYYENWVKEGMNENVNFLGM